MSLTSYRAAPPRVRCPVWGDCERMMVVCFLVFCGPGDDLLSRVLRHSTIGAEAFNGRVRDGIGFYAPRSSHRAGERQVCAANLID